MDFKKTNWLKVDVIFAILMLLFLTGLEIWCIYNERRILGGEYKDYIFSTYTYLYLFVVILMIIDCIMCIYKILKRNSEISSNSMIMSKALIHIFTCIIIAVLLTSFNFYTRNYDYTGNRTLNQAEEKYAKSLFKLNLNEGEKISNCIIVNNNNKSYTLRLMLYSEEGFENFYKRNDTINGECYNIGSGYINCKITINNDNAAEYHFCNRIYRKDYKGSIFEQEGYELMPPIYGIIVVSIVFRVIEYVLIDSGHDIIIFWRNKGEQKRRD